MRPVHLTDLHVAACALRALPAAEQTARMQQALAQADIADRFRKRLRKPHPVYGAGTLSSAFGAVDEPDYCDQAYCEAMQVVTASLLAKRAYLPSQGFFLARTP